MGKNYDFSGYATKANLLCSDGRIIRKEAFAHHDGQTVPLVWNHAHNKPEEVLGHALLEAREDGIYAYCSFNDTESGQTAKLLVQHGDINQLSIWANKLKQQGENVIHGMIREVSLVLAGANPGAFIDTVVAHGDDSAMEGNIYHDAEIDYVTPLAHADSDEKEDKEETKESEKTEEKENGEETVADILKTLNEKQKKAVIVLVGQAIEDAKKKSSDDASKDEVKHSTDEPEVEEKAEEEVLGEDTTSASEDVPEEEIKHSTDESKSAEKEETVDDVLETLNDKQKKVVYALLGMALKHKEAGKKNEGGNDDMKHNVFDQKTTNQEVLSHSEMKEIFADAQRCGSLKDAIIAHGITDIDVMFPDAKDVNNGPVFDKRNDDWVAKVLAGVHHAPFARIKTLVADITGAEARAKGYTKGNLKIEEVFKLLKRVTNPTTVYKKQKLDRDDILDIDFNVIPWLKGELRMMLDEEIARAYLIGDGRDPVEEADDKIDEECIRPIWKMEELFTVKKIIELAGTETAEDKAKAFIKASVQSRKDYKGSGNPTMFMPEDLLTDCLLIEDKNGRVIYDTVEKLAARLRVKEIVGVPVMENQTRTADDATYTLGGIYVNLKDYAVGTNKGGEINMFDDFDIDYNQYKYLMETRQSGTLVKPHSAVAIEFKNA